MKMQECLYFTDCSSPVCPLDKNKENAIWYPDEEICRKNVRSMWLKNQKKLIKKTKDKTKFYTFKMLNQKCIIKTGIVGIDPEREIKEQEISWFKRHPKDIRDYNNLPIKK